MRFSLLGSPAQGVTGWRGKVGKLELRGDVTDAPAWVSAEPFDVDLQWRDSPLRAKLSAGRGDVLGATLRILSSERGSAVWLTMPLARRQGPGTPSAES